jgi:signal transduction histidine kinase/DNA-binding NarL/FixJ family response regulator
MNRFPASNFIDSVPMLREDDSLAVVLTQFGQSRSNRAVVFNRVGEPIGVLELASLLPHVINLPTSGEGSASLQTVVQQPHTSLQCLLAETDLELESLALLPASWSLSRISPCLQSAEALHWGVVDDNGRLLGLLNTARFWQFWASCPPEPGIPASREPVVPPNLSLLAAETVLLQTMIDLLPVPLSLQTSGGGAIAQNLAWRQQLGDFGEWSQMVQEAALTLEEAVVEAAFRSEDWPAADDPEGRLHDGDLPRNRDEWEALINAAASDRHPFCRLSGSVPQTCICFAPSTSGQDRVWKLTRSPLPKGCCSSLAEPAQPIWLIMAQDVTEQYQLSREITSKTAELIQLHRFKDEFLACISHELKSPLTAVLGLSSLLKEQLREGLSDRQLRYTQLIHQSSRHLMMIVNDILDLTRIETGQVELVPEQVSIESVCLRAYEQACQLQVSSRETELRTQKVSFDLDIQADLTNIIADDLRLRQMLTNLLSNAMKFTPAGGDIGLRVETWDDWMAFTVWDNGIGIAREKQHLIFQKFQQLENPLTRRFEGTGLGLALTQRLARLHGGDITFTSVEGKGSQFTLLLPAPPPSLFRTTGSLRELQRRLVLVVEAEPLALEELRQQLAQAAYRVAIARSGTEALEKIRHLRPAIVLLNPHLPLLSGWDVLTLVKSNQETCQTPIIIMSAPADQVQANERRANGFLQLPIQPDTLQQQLKNLSEPYLPTATTILTILHLQSGQTPQIPDLTHHLYPYPCRVVEVDDLDQAELLTRVWKPQLVLLNGILPDPSAYMEQLTHCALLSSLPLVTLSVENTQAANQMSGLMVFPCLVAATPETLESDVSALLQVMQVAAGLD